jgi:hypothetical protein
LTLDEQHSSQNNITHHLSLFPYVDTRVPHWDSRCCFVRLVCSQLHQNKESHTVAGKSVKMNSGIHLMWTNKLIQIHPGNALDHTGDSQWMHSIS